MAIKGVQTVVQKKERMLSLGHQEVGVLVKYKIPTEVTSIIISPHHKDDRGYYSIDRASVFATSNGSHPASSFGSRTYTKPKEASYLVVSSNYTPRFFNDDEANELKLIHGSLEEAVLKQDSLPV